MELDTLLNNPEFAAFEFYRLCTHSILMNF